MAITYVVTVLLPKFANDELTVFHQSTVQPGTILEVHVTVAQNIWVRVFVWVTLSNTSVAILRSSDVHF